MPHIDSLTTDAALLSRAAAGDDTAFEVFVSRHESWLLRYARALAGPEAAEDLLQDTFVAAWRGAARFAPIHGDSARAWLATIARHARARHARRRAGEPSRFEPLEATEAMAVAAGWGALDPNEALERQLTRERLERALDSLPADGRAVLTLRDLEGWSGEETARALDLSVAAMKSRLHRARLQLLARLKGDVRG